MDPLVSCMCASVPSRWGLLQRAIVDYTMQTYTNRELVIAVSDPQYYEVIRGWVYTDFKDREDIRVYRRSFRQHSEAVLQLMAKSRGEYLAIWDDDNQNHPDRLKQQMISQVAYPHAMTALADAMYYFFETGELYITNHENPQGTASRRCAISTLIGARELWPDLRTNYRPHAVAAMANDFTNTGIKIATVGGLPFSHLVGVRGDNLRTEKTIRSIAIDSPNARKMAWLTARRSPIEAALAEMRFDEAAKVYLHGSDGEVGEYVPTNRWSASLYPVGQPDDKIERITES